MRLKVSWTGSNFLKRSVFRTFLRVCGPQDRTKRHTPSSHCRPAPFPCLSSLPLNYGQPQFPFFSCTDRRPVSFHRLRGTGLAFPGRRSKDPPSLDTFCHKGVKLPSCNPVFFFFLRDSNTLSRRGRYSGSEKLSTR